MCYFTELEFYFEKGKELIFNVYLYTKNKGHIWKQNSESFSLNLGIILYHWIVSLYITASMRNVCKLTYKN